MIQAEMVAPVEYIKGFDKYQLLISKEVHTCDCVVSTHTHTHTHTHARTHARTHAHYTMHPQFLE